jgi:hypothetical protein
MFATCFIKDAKMQYYWAYITRDEEDNLTACLSPRPVVRQATDRSGGRIVYLRPFVLPIDAIAHKHLLSDLSHSSLCRLIRHQRDFTESMLNIKI